MKKILMPAVLLGSLLNAQGEWTYDQNGLHDESGHKPNQNERRQIESITIEGVENVEDKAFEYCDKLAKVTILHGVKSIGQAAFCGCEALKDVSLPSSWKL